MANYYDERLLPFVLKVARDLELEESGEIEDKWFRFVGEMPMGLEFVHVALNEHGLFVHAHDKSDVEIDLTSNFMKEVIQEMFRQGENVLLSEIVREGKGHQAMFYAALSKGLR